MRVFRILPPIAFTLEKLFAKNLPKIRASPSRRTRDVPRLFCRRRRQKEDAKRDGTTERVRRRGHYEEENARLKEDSGAASAGYRCTEGGAVKKVVCPQGEREAVPVVREEGKLSE